MSKLRTIAVFVGLKVLEIGSVVMVPYWIGSIPVIRKESTWAHSALDVWTVGLSVLMLLLVVAIVSALVIFVFLPANWWLARKITGRQN